MRLAQYIAHTGHCSRRQASRVIEQARVTVNGLLAGHLHFVDDNDEVAVDGELVTMISGHRYFLYHKPVGVDCNLNGDDPNSLIHFMPTDEGMRLFPVGRLDKDSSGLLVLTNDGHLANRWLSPKYKHAKEYEVSVIPSFWRQQRQDITLNDVFINGMNTPMLIKGKATTKCEVIVTDKLSFTISMTQGLNRQIRRMCANQGYKVTNLKRVAFAGFRLGELAIGTYKEVIISIK